MTKLNISMPPELLTQIDAEADELGISRSGLIQEASARYIALSRADRESELRKLRGRAAARRMKEIGAEMGLSGSDAVGLLAAARAQQDARRG
jgi:metal-responsive CopG/Arc/MetJ family transcriptional regulator